MCLYKLKYNICLIFGMIEVQCDNVSPPCLKFKGQNSWYFSTGDCTGQPYVSNSSYWFHVMHKLSVVGVYYIHDIALPRVVKSNIKSYYSVDNPGNCIAYSSADTASYIFPIKQIAFPLADVELAYPITIRQVQ